MTAAASIAGIDNTLLPRWSAGEGHGSEQR
jgi:hypothetical protein